MEAAIITTYRCNMRCQMCNIWRFPTKKEEEFKAEILNKLPGLSFCNVTGGEPFLRDDIEKIVYILKKRPRELLLVPMDILPIKLSISPKKIEILE